MYGGRSSTSVVKIIRQLLEHCSWKNWTTLLVKSDHTACRLDHTAIKMDHTLGKINLTSGKMDQTAGTAVQIVSCDKLQSPLAAGGLKELEEKNT